MTLEVAEGGVQENASLGDVSVDDLSDLSVEFVVIGEGREWRGTINCINHSIESLFKGLVQFETTYVKVEEFRVALPHPAAQSPRPHCFNNNRDHYAANPRPLASLHLLQLRPSLVPLGVPICRLTVRVPPSNLIHEYPQFSAISRFQSHGLPELRVTAVNPDSITFPRTIDKIDRHAFTAKRDDQPIENRWVIPGGPVLTFLSPQPRSRVEMDFAPTFADILEELAPRDAPWMAETRCPGNLLSMVPSASAPHRVSFPFPFAFVRRNETPHQIHRKVGRNSPSP
jgi:hypothetical protein